MEQIKKKIKVNVAGETASGKSTILWAFVKYLKEHGIDVTLCSDEYKSIEHLQSSMEHDITLEQRLEYLSDRVSIEVEEINIVKNPSYGKH